MGYDIRPREHELREARTAAEQALESCRYTLEKEEDLEINLGSSSSLESGEHGAHGLAVNSGVAQIYFDAGVDEWKEDLGEVMKQVYGKSWFYENFEGSGFVWTEFLAESFALMFLEEFSDGKTPEVTDELEEEWSEKKEKLSEELVEAQEDFSWQVKWLVGRELAMEHELEEFTGLTKSDIEEKGEEVFE
jgi:hypothetical protein